MSNKELELEFINTHYFSSAIIVSLTIRLFAFYSLENINFHIEYNLVGNSTVTNGPFCLLLHNFN